MTDEAIDALVWEAFEGVRPSAEVVDRLVGDVPRARRVSWLLVAAVAATFALVLYATRPEPVQGEPSAAASGAPLPVLVSLVELDAAGQAALRDHPLMASPDELLVIEEDFEPPRAERVVTSPTLEVPPRGLYAEFLAGGGADGTNFIAQVHQSPSQPGWMSVKLTFPGELESDATMLDADLTSGERRFGLVTQVDGVWFLVLVEVDPE